MIGQNVVDRSGDKIGTVEDVYLDKDTRQPEWALVNMGLFGAKQSFVPLANARVVDGGLQTAYEKAQVKEAPRAEPGGELSQDEEAQLYGHYGFQYTEDRSDSGLPAGGAHQTERGEVRDTSGPNTDSAMTRSEEELSVGKVRRPSELVRLRKEIVTENVTTTVPVEKEVLRVERETITEQNMGDAMSGADLSTEESEITLSEEEVVVDKKVVPKERVRLEKDVEVDQREVKESVRKEQITTERGEPGRPRS
jgi:uncharacterized protein (TIGR02271 family)